eukprot:TRINITY_DN295_c0_g2_i1.p1 TRINITY_DN295_c0_g2~~TRINITY_DN295_c0_g2_i1.p1  ORF type:complete len:137 (+),score=9.92 TRINITY_DN295_c0_g2_i1:596-1006(+)
MEIALISHQHLVHMFVAVPINLPEPAHNCCEAFLVSHIVHNDDAVCPPVVAAGDGAETLLSGSVPLSKQVSLSGDKLLGTTANLNQATNGDRVVLEGFGEGKQRQALTICSLMTLLSISTVLILKSTPMVLMYVSV